jgi:anti-anti-sigma factor
MEITKVRSGDLLNVRVSGRLDNYWSESFDEALDEMVREGAHHLRMDLSGVDYISSAAIGVLVKIYRNVGKLQGSFVISAASDRVRSVLRMVALESVLFAAAPVATAAVTVEAQPRQIESEIAMFDCYPLGGNASEYRLLGHPATLAQGAYAANDVKSITANSDTFALGLGALGHNYDECRELFGEFIAAAGSAAYMPTDATSTPDYMMSQGELVPQIQALYAISFRGSPCHLLRFESSGATALPFREIVRACTQVAGAAEFGIVMAAEVAGLVCAVLRRSPVEAAARFEFPGVREWLSFTPEHEHARTSSLVVGVASATPGDSLRPFVRPVSDDCSGHFHAAVTAFRSLPRGKLDISEVLAQVFQPRSVISVVHLLRDNRPIEGAGESEFLRGACWIFPLKPGGAS